MENKIELSLKRIIYSKLQNDAYVMTLTEINSERQIPIIIGSNEAQSIIIAIEQIKSPRPLTHDLFCNFAAMLKIQLQHIEIYKFRDGIFYARLFLQKENNEILTLDARTSDAVALAIRCHCPMYTNEEVLNVTGVTLEEISTTKQLASNIENRSVEKLQKMMNSAIADENYEEAAILRDEIKKRSK
ncbi:MAG: bifunctional nuclease family protein [Bacteroidales bacterium]|nr:bifunctional nuclease family protein [Bacteroidales bacterium]